MNSKDTSRQLSLFSILKTKVVLNFDIFANKEIGNAIPTLLSHEHQIINFFGIALFHIARCSCTFETGTKSVQNNVCTLLRISITAYQKAVGQKILLLEIYLFIKNVHGMRTKSKYFKEFIWNIYRKVKLSQGKPRILWDQADKSRVYFLRTHIPANSNIMHDSTFECITYSSFLLV